MQYNAFHYRALRYHPISSSATFPGFLSLANHRARRSKAALISQTYMKSTVTGLILYSSAVGADYGKPCSDIYPGLWPFSEPEARNLGKYMYSIRRRIKGYVDFHCYGQLWMSPWGFTTALPPTFHKEHVSLNRWDSKLGSSLMYRAS